MSPDRLARARQLIAELSALLDEFEGAPAKAPRKVSVPMPERAAGQKTVDMVRRSLRRKGVVA